MSPFNNLRNEMLSLEKESGHKGYWYRISDVLTILICGLLCRQQRIDDVQDRSNARPVRAFLQEQFGIAKVPCRAQFYNILRYVDADKFNAGFSRWMKGVVQAVAGKTVSVDGKTVRGTE